MVKPSRNEPCPCGSGKKYKKCCLLKTASERPIVTPDATEDADLIIFSESMLMNRVHRDAQAVAASFDLIARDAVPHLEEMYGRVAALLYAGLKKSNASDDDLRRTCAIVLTNALKRSE